MPQLFLACCRTNNNPAVSWLYVFYALGWSYFGFPNESLSREIEDIHPPVFHLRTHFVFCTKFVSFLSHSYNEIFGEEHR